MAIYIYLTHLPGYKARSLHLTTKEEADAFISSQESNQFIPEAKRITFEPLGKAESVLQNQRLFVNSQFDSFGFSEGADCKDLDLSPLALSSFRSLGIHNKSVLSNKTFPTLNGVEELIIGKPADDIDLSKFPNLKVLRVLEWNQKIHFSNGKNVSLITIGGFKSNRDAFQQLHAFRDASELVLNKTSCVDLQGIEILQRLKKLKINYASKLENIRSISGLHNLTDVMFEFCKKINDYSALGACRQLSRIVISNCGNISSLDFLTHLKNLRELVILETSISDADLSVLDKLKDRGVRVRPEIKGSGMPQNGDGVRSHIPTIEKLIR